MVRRVNGNNQETRNEVKSQKPTVPWFLIGILIPQEHEVDDRGQSIRSIKCKFSSFGAYRINGKT